MDVYVGPDAYESSHQQDPDPSLSFFSSSSGNIPIYINVTTFTREGHKHKSHCTIPRGRSWPLSTHLL